MSTTALSGDQVLQSAYDPPTQSIKTLITANISGAQEVIISAVDDSIQIGDGLGHFLAINPDGSINTSGTSAVTGTVDTNLLGLASFQTSQYTVGVTATQITVTPLANRSSMSIKVVTTSSVDVVYVGNSSGVTTSTGYPLFNGDSLQLDVKGTQTVYVIGTAAGQRVFALELG